MYTAGNVIYEGYHPDSNISRGIPTIHYFFRLNYKRFENFKCIFLFCISGVFEQCVRAMQTLSGLLKHIGEKCNTNKGKRKHHQGSLIVKCLKICFT